MIATVAVWPLLAVLATHAIADFVVQTSRQAKLKSTDTSMLTLHVITYSTCLLVTAMFLSGGALGATLIFVGINGLAHWVTDFFTSRASSWAYENQDVHLYRFARLGSVTGRAVFWAIIGLDQFLHTFMLVCTMRILEGI